MRYTYDPWAAEGTDGAATYFKTGAGKGSITHAVIDGTTRQSQESGRDQRHTQLALGLLASLCEVAYSQGDDLYGYPDNRLLKGFEYRKKYDVGCEMPFKTFANVYGTRPIISTAGRGRLRPIYEQVWNHYEKRKGIGAPYTKHVAEKMRPEGWNRDHSSFGTPFFSG